MMGAIIDVMQWVVIIYLMIMLGLTNRRLSRMYFEPPVVYRTLPDPPEEKAICGCEHHQCFHDEKGCGADYDRCGCKRYMGPEHLPQVIP